MLLLVPPPKVENDKDAVRFPKQEPNDHCATTASNNDQSKVLVLLPPQTDLSSTMIVPDTATTFSESAATAGPPTATGMATSSGWFKDFDRLSSAAAVQFPPSLLFSSSILFPF
ncbi:hypothetical protein BX616_003537 [Lobosporangium transversale]|nr:hypothetical protein BX616_003537 [Lobosporangium transversale]